MKVESSLRLIRVSKFLERAIAHGCGRLATFVSRWPHTRAFKDEDWVGDRFGDNPEAGQVYLNRRGSQTSVLSKEALLEVFDLYDLVLTIDSENHVRGFDERSCEQVYWRRDGIDLVSPTTTCQKESVLAFWDYNRTKLIQDPDVLATINRKDKVDCCARSHEYVSLPSVVGKLRYDDPSDSSKVTGAGALCLFFYLETHNNRQSRNDPHAFRLLNKFSRRLRDQSYAYFERPMPATSWDSTNSREESNDADRAFVNYAFIIIIFYAFFALYSRRAPDRSRGSLGLGAVLCVLLSTLAAFGLAIGAFNVTFSPSTGVAIFVVLGIGLDDSFVIAGAVDDPFEDQDYYDPNASPIENDARHLISTGATIEDVAAKRIIHTLSSSGPSITVTSITDAAAFIAGSFVDIPDIAAFNRFCAISVLVDYAMQLTFFVAIFTIDQRRRLRAKVEDVKRRQAGVPNASSCLQRLTSCCAPPLAFAENRILETETGREVELGRVMDGDSNENGNDGTDVKTMSPAVLVDDSAQAAPSKILHSDPAVHFWGNTYANALLSPLGKLFVLSSTVAILALAIVGSKRIEMDIDDNWGVVTNPALKAFNFEKKHFGSIALHVYTKRTDYYKNRQAFYDMLEGYGELNFVFASSLQNNWYAAYDTWLNETNQTNSNYDEWLEKLKTFLSTDDGVAYSTKIIIDDSKGVVATQIDSSWVAEGYFGGTGKRRMRMARKKVRGTPLGTVIVYQGW
ncbi:hypothetical protein CTAYLR_006423 [Chrysophaeum taylorii]|uniref:SSD domain-containing protein n=1 Tax=Chrysophaeum taylorii TaxID=2483200 RepID=A0AAD7U9K7_9STRA|nr:hypothetical protein CTAYLR_006423 [Chrysophaeum taylorii]